MERILDDVARRSFRDQADRDYMVARMCYRQEFEQQFLWSALQAIEKYLKAILVFNHCSAKNIGHNISKALGRVERIDYLQFGVPPDVSEFLDYLNMHGANRYLIKPSVVREHALDDLDRAVWYIRRYCIFMLRRKPGTNPIEHMPVLNRLRYSTNTKFEENPTSFSLPDSGYLEEILRESKKQATVLVWRNLYFGKRAKGKRRPYSGRVASVVRPTHSVWADTIGLLAQYIDLPREIRGDEGRAS